MKLDFHGIRFRFWFAFFSLAVGITSLLGVMQIGFVGPYYRNAKIKTVSEIAERIAGDLTDSSFDQNDNAMQEAIKNDICVVIYNDAGKQVYQADSLGVGCIFNAASDKKPEQLRDMNALRKKMDTSDSEYTMNFQNAVTDEQMIVYGKKVMATLSNYYLFINSPLQPVSSIYSMFISQYSVYTVVVIVIASLFAFMYSRQITAPIVNMQKMAKKLAKADYSVHFEGGSFTETKQLASTLNAAADSLEHIDTLRRDLIANLSHDIRTPLTDIRAYAEMIRDISGDKPEKREKHLNVIIRETEYMESLINDMKELSSMQSGNYEIHSDEVDVCRKVNEIVELNRALIHKSGVIICLDMPDMCIVSTDEVKLGQVIQNYLTNAIKHTPSGKMVTLRVKEKTGRDTFRIEVEDEGEGIAQAEIPYIWDRYYKSSRTFRRDMNSTGLGLAIVKSIAETMDADYGCISSEKKGSLFYFETAMHIKKK